MLALTDQEFTALYTRHVGMVYRVCFAYMKCRARTDDMVQETFVRAMTRAPRFDGPTHEKAWLIRTATNVCKDSLKSWWRRSVNLDPAADTTEDNTTDTTLTAVLALPDRYKAAVYLFYYEGYATAEIATMLDRPESTVRNHLSEARRLLRAQLTLESPGGDSDAQS